MSELTILQKNGITNMVCKNEDCHTPETNCPCTIIDQCECPTLKEVIEKLAHYEDLEEQGKLVLFPSYAYFIKDKKVHKGWVQEVMYWHNRKPLYDIRYDDNSLANYRGYLGLTVFLTKEEAEAKLAELKGTEE